MAPGLARHSLGWIRVWVWVLALGLAAPACGSREAEPVAVARSFAEACRRGDVDAMLQVIEQPAVDRVREAAERASDQVGGRRSIETNEMLQIVGVDRTVAVAEAELLEEDGRNAKVQLTMTDGRSLVIDLVWEQPGAKDDGLRREGGWKVRVPVPSEVPPSAVPTTPDA
jgi:hypothetical protein